MARQFSTWFTIWRRLMIWAFVSSLIPPRVLSATVMQTSQGCGTRHLHLWTPVLSSHEVVVSFSMRDALSLEPPNYNPKLQCPLLKLGILQCHKLYVTSFLSWDYYKKWGSEISRFFVSCPMCIAQSLKTTQAPSNWQGFPSFALEPSTSTYATIIFANMCKRVLSKYSPLTPKIRLLMLLPSPWHKTFFNIIIPSCVAGDLHKLPKWGSVTLLVLQYLFYRYLGVSPGTAQKSTAQKCNILLSVEIPILEIQRALLSMGTSNVRFLEKGASDLFVLTWRLQDLLYREVWKTYSSFSIGLGKQIIQISLIVGFSRVTSIIHHTFEFTS